MTLFTHYTTVQLENRRDRSNVIQKEVKP